MTTKECKYCGQIFERPSNVSTPSWVKRIYCSRKCMGLSKVTSTCKTCSNCGKGFLAQNYIKDKVKFCSHKCSSDFRISKNFQEEVRVRKSQRYKKWRKSVLERDKYTCVMCGCVKVKSELNVDHIKSFALFPESRLNVDNGRTLCIPCHKKTFTYGASIKRQKVIAA